MCERCTALAAGRSLRYLRRMSLLRRCVVAGVFLTSAMAAGEARAQAMGDGPAIILSADRLVPLFSYTRESQTETQNNTTTTRATSGSALSLLWGVPGQNATVHNIPRAAFDFKFGMGLTVGGAVAFAFGLGGSTNTETKNGATTTNTSVDSPKSTIFGFAPRAGYMIPLTERIIFWPRGGFGVYSVSTRSEIIDNQNNVRRTSSNTDTIVSLDLDPQFAFIPIEHFFFNVGPLVNIPLTGTRKVETVNGPVTQSRSDDLAVFHFGITAGLGGYIGL